jgi:hypothetical protein
MSFNISLLKIFGEQRTSGNQSLLSTQFCYEPKTALKTIFLWPYNCFKKAKMKWKNMYLSFFHVIIVNNEAINMKYRYLFETLISIVLDKYLQQRLLDHGVALLFILWEASVLFFVFVITTYTPSIVDKGSHFSTSLPTLIFFIIAILKIVK